MTLYAVFNNPSRQFCGLQGLYEVETDAMRGCTGRTWFIVPLPTGAPLGKPLDDMQLEYVWYVNQETKEEAIARMKEQR